MKKIKTARSFVTRMTKEKSQTIEHKFDKMSHSNQVICDFDASEFPRMRSQKMLRNYTNFMELSWQNVAANKGYRL